MLVLTEHTLPFDLNTLGQTCVGKSHKTFNHASNVRKQKDNSMHGKFCYTNANF